MKDVTFTEGTEQDAARFEEVVAKLANYVGTQLWPLSLEIANAMDELLAPVHDEPTKPLHKYYVHLEEGAEIPNERAQTTSRF